MVAPPARPHAAGRAAGVVGAVRRRRRRGGIVPKCREVGKGGGAIDAGRGRGGPRRRRGLPLSVVPPRGRRGRERRRPGGGERRRRRRREAAYGWRRAVQPPEGEGGGAQSREEELGDVRRPRPVGLHARKNPLQGIDVAVDVAPLVPIPHALAAPLPPQAASTAGGGSTAAPDRSAGALRGAPPAAPALPPRRRRRTAIRPLYGVEARLAEGARVLLIGPPLDAGEAEGVDADLYRAQLLMRRYLEAYAARRRLLLLPPLLLLARGRRGGSRRRLRRCPPRGRRPRDDGRLPLPPQAYHPVVIP